ncbi:MAG TPA: type II toxin-antitoxin system RelE/ParE family toxin [Terracidiphilus sp.]
MKYPVRMTSAAWRDLEEICIWIADHDSPAKAGHVLDRLAQTAEKISIFPHRGSRPNELPEGTEAEFRQVYFKPYRLIYEVAGREVVIHLVCDVRRNLQSLLMRRILGR